MKKKYIFYTYTDFIHLKKLVGANRKKSHYINFLQYVESADLKQLNVVSSIIYIIVLHAYIGSHVPTRLGFTFGLIPSYKETFQPRCSVNG